MDVKISIIIPVYNVERYIAECVNSVLAQTYRNFECILVDDCSPDGSIDVVQVLLSESECKDKFKIVAREKNGGISAARNTGIRLATGDYLLFVDSDDKLYPNALETFVSVVCKYPDVDLVQANFIRQDTNKVRYDSSLFPEYIIGKKLIEKTLRHWILPTTAWNKLIKRSLVVDDNLYFMEGILHEDVHWRWLIHRHINSFAISGIATYWYRTDNSSSVTNNADLTRSFVSKVKIFEEIAKKASSIEDIFFDIHFLPYDAKVACWNGVKDKKAALSQLELSKKKLMESNVDARLIRHLSILKLPLWVIDNFVFAKLYYEYEKHFGLTMDVKIDFDL